MAFELFTPDKAVPRGEPMVTLTSYGRISLNKTATHRLQKQHVKFVQLLWDAENAMIAISPSDKTPAAFPLAYGTNGNGVGFGASTFLTYIGYDWSKTRNYSIEWDDNSEIYVFRIPRSNLGAEVTGAHLRRNRASSSLNA